MGSAAQRVIVGCDDPEVEAQVRHESPDSHRWQFRHSLSAVVRAAGQGGGGPSLLVLDTDMIRARGGPETLGRLLSQSAQRRVVLVPKEQLAVTAAGLAGPANDLTRALHRSTGRLKLSRQAMAEITRRVDDLGRRPPPSLRETRLARAMTGRPDDGRDSAAIEVSSLISYFAERSKLLAGVLSTAEVAKLLGTSRQTPHDRARAQTLLAISDGGELGFPPWQFDPDGPDGVIEGFPATLRALRGGALAKARWLVRPHAALERRTPIEALRDGDRERVIREARGVGVA